MFVSTAIVVFCFEFCALILYVGTCIPTTTVTQHATLVILFTFDDVISESHFCGGVLFLLLFSRDSKCNVIRIKHRNSVWVKFIEKYLGNLHSSVFCNVGQSVDSARYCCIVLLSLGYGSVIVT